jgi:hypothetical protein
VADDRQQDQDEVDPAGRKQVFALGHYSMICVGLAQGIASAQLLYCMHVQHSQTSSRSWGRAHPR